MIFINTTLTKYWIIICERLDMNYNYFDIIYIKEPTHVRNDNELVHVIYPVEQFKHDTT